MLFRSDALGHAVPRNVAVQGLEVSLRHLLQDLLLQRQIVHQSPQTTVFFLQLFQPSSLFQLQSAVLFPPAVIVEITGQVFLVGEVRKLGGPNTSVDRAASLASGSKAPRGGCIHLDAVFHLDEAFGKLLS